MTAEPEGASGGLKAVRFRVAACAVFLVVLQVGTIRAGLPLALAGAADFRAFYAAGHLVRTGRAGQVYDFNVERQAQEELVQRDSESLPFVYPVFAALPFVALSLLSYRTAYFVFLAINAMLAIAAALVLGGRLGGLKRLWPPLTVLLMLGFLPVGEALLQGQVSIFLLLAFSAAFVALEDGRGFVAGLLLSLALVKFHVVLPVVVLFALWRYWRVVAGFAAGAMGLGVVSLAVAGPTGAMSYARSMMSAAATGAVGAGAGGYAMFSARMPNLHGFFYALSGGARWGTVLVVVSSVAVLVWAAVQPPSLARAIVASLLISYHLHPHDLSLLLIPVCLVFNEVAEAGEHGDGVLPPGLTIFAAMLWMVSPLQLVLLGANANYLLAPAMLPFLLRDRSSNAEYKLPPGLKHSLGFYMRKPWVKLGQPILLFEHLLKTYGNIAHYRFMGTPIIFINEPEYIREVLINQAPAFVKERTLKRMKILLGEGLITADDPIHMRQRKIAAPAFHRQRIAAYGDTIVASAAAHAAKWKDGETIDANAAMMELSLEIIARTLFGLEVTDDIRSINDETNAIMDIYNFLVAMPKLEAWLHWPLPILNRFRRSRERLNAVVDRIIAEHRASDVDKGDLLSMLIASRYEAADGSASAEGMSDTQVRDEVLTIFLAGYETVANALTWTWYCLSQNPDVEREFHAELDRVLGLADGEHRVPTLADYPALAYTEMVFAESMRLYPPAWAMGRMSTKPVTLGPYRIPAGSHFFFSQYVLHRSERYFPDPLRFDPMRHTAEAKAGRDKFVYFPFGGGGRQCIGESFAWMEGVLALATIASRWRLVYVGDGPPVPQAKITLRPRDPLLMRVVSRRALPDGPATHGAVTS